ncbi:MAG: helix-turn-helix transcriptional regulator [Bulleidia sp.]|nr:helix-turn-helix transcriptional regulator [Bulleidia sp.]
MSVFVWNVAFPWFGFAELRAIYKWQNGETLPSVDNLYALGTLLNVPMEQILITVSMLIQQYEQQDVSCCSFLCNYFRHNRKTVRFSHFSIVYS